VKFGPSLTPSWLTLEKASIVIALVSGLLGIYFYVRALRNAASTENQ
jgi:uncharacterized protein (DUF2164 family)